MSIHFYELSTQNLLESSVCMNGFCWRASRKDYQAGVFRWVTPKVRICASFLLCWSVSPERSHNPLLGLNLVASTFTWGLGGLSLQHVGFHLLSCFGCSIATLSYPPITEPRVQESTVCLRLFGLLSQNAIDWGAYKQHRCISPSLEAGNPEALGRFSV